MSNPSNLKPNICLPPNNLNSVSQNAFNLCYYSWRNWPRWNKLYLFAYGKQMFLNLVQCITTMLRLPLYPRDTLQPPIPLLLYWFPYPLKIVSTWYSDLFLFLIFCSRENTTLSALNGWRSRGTCSSNIGLYWSSSPLYCWYVLLPPLVFYFVFPYFAKANFFEMWYQTSQSC